MVQHCWGGRNFFIEVRICCQRSLVLTLERPERVAASSAEVKVWIYKFDPLYACVMWTKRAGIFRL